MYKYKKKKKIVVTKFWKTKLIFRETFTGNYIWCKKHQAISDVAVNVVLCEIPKEKLLLENIFPQNPLSKRNQRYVKLHQH